MQVDEDDPPSALPTCVRTLVPNVDSRLLARQRVQADYVGVGSLSPRHLQRQHLSVLGLSCIGGVAPLTAPVILARCGAKKGGDSSCYAVRIRNEAVLAEGKQLQILAHGFVFRRRCEP